MKPLAARSIRTLPGGILSRRAVLFAALALPVAAAAQGAASDPATPITELIDALGKTMRAGKATPFRQRFDMLAPVVEQVFNLPQILQTSIGLRWKDLPAEKQTQLLDVFRRYTIASYVANFDDATSSKLEMLTGRRSSGADQIVETQLKPNNGEPVRIDYLLRQTDGAWRVVDVLLDGSISRVAVQRSDFRTLLGSGDGSALIASLQQKIGTLSGGALQS